MASRADEEVFGGSNASAPQFTEPTEQGNETKRATNVEIDQPATRRQKRAAEISVLELVDAAAARQGVTGAHVQCEREQLISQIHQHFLSFDRGLPICQTQVMRGRSIVVCARVYTEESTRVWTAA